MFVNRPGPASSVEDRSLRKIFVQGDRGSNLAEDLTFQSRFSSNFALMIDGNLQLSDELHQLTQP